MYFFKVVGLAFVHSRIVTAWGAVGHETVGTIAQHYLTSQAQTWVSNILGSGVSLASVATWADTFRETSAGRFSAGFQLAITIPPSQAKTN